jgi:hypothetical protein
MKIIGGDLYPDYQQMAVLDLVTGEMVVRFFGVDGKSAGMPALVERCNV